jgi:hypothetical protein
VRLTSALYGLYFNTGNAVRLREGSVMKPVDIKNSIELDRLATWNEVRCAMSFSTQGAFERVSACDDFREIDSDFSGRAYNLPEDKMWSAIISEMLDSKIN